ncbi:MAG: hypothetical protein IJI66_03320 [Erysipelotrichaceae bacterium]|nr:hypothetical protein [Erysipelotrichaceae bacterium]
MKSVVLDSYEIIFNSLIKEGYSEEEAEQLICNVIEDQISFCNYAERIHNIIQEEINNPDKWS